MSEIEEIFRKRRERGEMDIGEAWNKIDTLEAEIAEWKESYRKMNLECMRLHNENVALKAIIREFLDYPFVIKAKSEVFIRGLRYIHTRMEELIGWKPPDLADPKEELDGSSDNT